MHDYQASQVSNGNNMTLAEKLERRDAAFKRIVDMLEDGPMSVADIALVLDAHRTTVNNYMHQIARNLRQVRRNGKLDRYRRELWELGEDPTLPTEDELYEKSLAQRLVIAPARQMGMGRDFLVHALFGWGSAKATLPY